MVPVELTAPLSPFRLFPPPPPPPPPAALLRFDPTAGEAAGLPSQEVPLELRCGGLLAAAVCQSDTLSDSLTGGGAPCSSSSASSAAMTAAAAAAAERAGRRCAAAAGRLDRGPGAAVLGGAIAPAAGTGGGGDGASGAGAGPVTRCEGG